MTDAAAAAVAVAGTKVPPGMSPATAGLIAPILPPVIANVTDACEDRRATGHSLAIFFSVTDTFGNGFFHRSEHLSLKPFRTTDAATPLESGMSWNFLRCNP